jgi:uncharacterized lipoprotein YehR (DUF1307 family)
MKLKSILIPSIAIGILTGCTTLDTVMDSWEGSSIDDLTASWGAPSSRMRRTDGGYTYTWSSIRSNEYGVSECRKTFVSNAEGIIIKTTYSNCSKYRLK